MVSSINSTTNIYPAQQFSPKNTRRISLNDFSSEDEAIISSEAKLLNELEKYNSGQSDELDLAITAVTGKNQVEAAAQVINAKKDMMDTILKIGE